MDDNGWSSSTKTSNKALAVVHAVKFGRETLYSSLPQISIKFSPPPPWEDGGSKPEMWAFQKHGFLEPPLKGLSAAKGSICRLLKSPLGWTLKWDPNWDSL